MYPHHGLDHLREYQSRACHRLDAELPWLSIGRERLEEVKDDIGIGGWSTVSCVARGRSRSIVSGAGFSYSGSNVFCRAQDIDHALRCTTPKNLLSNSPSFVIRSPKLFSS